MAGMKWAALAAMIATAAATAAPAWAEMQLSAPGLTAEGVWGDAQVMDGFGCAGGNLSPELAWSGLPEGTATLAVTIHDPDAPTGSGWWHWGVYNLPATVAGLGEGASSAGLPEGALQGQSDFGTHSYGGACPPEGDAAHRYVVTLWALPQALPEDAGTTGAMLGFYLNAMALEKAEVVATYGR
ncbi:MAG: YbhB/YbcL family Raf kinase inhibitor-like protein [Paracoccaceae bacterium]